MGWNDRSMKGPGYQHYYSIYMKSHAFAPDYEDGVWADSFDEAVDYFYNHLDVPSREYVAECVKEETDEARQATEEFRQEAEATGS